LVDALDLGSSGAIRGGSSPPFRTEAFGLHRSIASVIQAWGFYEKEKRDPRFFEEEKGGSATRSSGGSIQESASAFAESTGPSEAGVDVGQVRKTRLITNSQLSG